MALYFIGLGLNDEKDITLNALEAIKKCSKVFLEVYTSRLNCKIESMEKLYGKKITIADRELVEKSADQIILPAIESDVAFLVIGDIFSATTHVDMLLRAKEKNVECRFFHNASVMTAVGQTGLEIYKFGKTTSIPFLNENVKTPVAVYKSNDKSGLHTLFLLDLDPKNERFMTFSQAAEYLIKNKIKKTTMAIGLAALGTPNTMIIYSTLEKLSTLEEKHVPQCLIIHSKLHFIEEEALMMHKL